jgi:SPP1 family predicted phage head-tail adaptor
MKGEKLDRRVDLQHRTLTRNTTNGEEVETWSTYAAVWAEKKDVRGREFFAAQQSNSDITTTWRIRYRGDVVATDKLVHGGLSYNVTSIAEIGRRDGLELQATAVRP